jgi:ABC-type Na+ efflux pump permease subunit
MPIINVWHVINTTNSLPPRERLIMAALILLSLLVMGGIWLIVEMFDRHS